MKSRCEVCGEQEELIGHGFYKGVCLPCQKGMEEVNADGDEYIPDWRDEERWRNDDISQAMADYMRGDY